MLMIVSDHGFQGARRKFCINEYLRRQELLRMKKGGNHYRSKLFAILKELIMSLKLRKFVLSIENQMYRMKMFRPETEHHGIKPFDIDWANTRAWIPSASGGIANYVDIFLADSLTEKEISILIDALREIRDPKTGQPLASDIYREDAFGIGPFAPPERHIILLADENVSLLLELGMKSLWHTISGPKNGIHHPDGILYLYGAQVKKGITIAPSHVYDVVPTILSYLDLPVPEGLEGKIISEAFIQPLRVSSRGDSKVLQKLKKLAMQA